MTHVVSIKVNEGNHFAFRPFTDDTDRVSGAYEATVRRLISPRPSEVIVDIGANIGVHTVWLSRKVGPSGKVLAVEAERANFTILNLNRQINNLTNVISTNVALGADSGNGQLLVPRPTLMGQVTTIASNRFPSRSVVSANFETLDRTISAYDMTQVSAIKIDVEGAELSVVRGAEKTIMKFRPRLVIETHGSRNLVALRLLLRSMNMTVTTEVRASSRPDEERFFVLAISPEDSQKRGFE